jgi:X-X-X-Leu-X-X-Gly heptad repeat protein
MGKTRLITLSLAVLLALSPGALVACGDVQRGVNKVQKGAEKVKEGAKNVQQGAKKVQEGAKKAGGEGGGGY